MEKMSSAKFKAVFSLLLVSAAFALAGFFLYFGPFLMGIGGEPYATGFRIALDFKRNIIGQDGNIAALAIAMFFTLISGIRTLGETLTFYLIRIGKIRNPREAKSYEEKKAFFISDFLSGLLRLACGIAVFFVVRMTKLDNVTLGLAAIFSGVCSVISALVYISQGIVRYLFPRPKPSPVEETEE